jgi:hypothetical protein
VRAVRIALGVLGGLAIGYGGWRLLHGLPPPLLLLLGGWLLAAVAIHHGVLSPAVLAVGAGLRRYVPDRARGFVQGGLMVAAAVTIIAVPLILRQGSQPTGKAMLLADYRVNLLVLLAGIAVGTLIAYAVRVARDRTRGASTTSTASPT